MAMFMFLAMFTCWVAAHLLLSMLCMIHVVAVCVLMDTPIGTVSKAMTGVQIVD